MIQPLKLLKAARLPAATVATLAIAAFLACKERPTAVSTPDATGPGQRKVLGDGATYDPDPRPSEVITKELAGSLAKRRAFGWDVVRKLLRPVPLSEAARSTAGGAELPRVPAWLTWYTADEMQKVFEIFYADVKRAGGNADLEALAKAALGQYAAQKDADAPVQDFYERLVKALQEGGDTAAAQAAGLGKGDLGVSVTLFSPRTVEHYLVHYADVAACVVKHISGDEPVKPVLFDARLTEDVFGGCFGEKAPFPPDAVAVKSRWLRVAPGVKLHTAKTDAASLVQATATPTGAWRDAPGRDVPAPDAGHIYKVRVVTAGASHEYALTGLHVTTKEVPEWVWVSLWWSDEPDADFGADRPESLCARSSADCDADERALAPFRNYKMCVTSTWKEADTAMRGVPDAVTQPLKAMAEKTGGASWCSNQYIEFGTKEVASNCIGCHQFAAPGEVFTRPAAGSKHNVLDKRANNFLADFMWSFAQAPDEVAAKINDTKQGLDSTPAATPAP